MRRRARRVRDAVVVAAALLVTAVVVLLGARAVAPPAIVSARLARPAAPAITPSEATRSPEAVASITTRARVLLPDEAGRLTVPLADPVPPRLPVDGVPAGWTVKEFAGKAMVELVRSEAGLALRLRSEGSSFALARDVLVDLHQFPVLTWSWKVTQLPGRGDVRHASTDDQAAQVYVVFPRWPSPSTQSDVVGYIWDTSAPVGTRLASPKAPNVRVIVLESGPTHLGSWVDLQRNVLTDYRELFGREAPRVGGVAVMIDANDTRGEAEALVARLAFVRDAAVESKRPTPVLR